MVMINYNSPWIGWINLVQPTSSNPIGLGLPRPNQEIKLPSCPTWNNCNIVGLMTKEWMDDSPCWTIMSINLLY